MIITRTRPEPVPNNDSNTDLLLAMMIIRMIMYDLTHVNQIVVVPIVRRDRLFVGSDRYTVRGRPRSFNCSSHFHDYDSTFH